MKKGLTVLLILLGLCSFSQQMVFPKAPEQFSKIRFTYVQKSKLYIDDTGVYADTLIMKRSFPGHAFQKKQTDGFVFGFIPLNELTEKEKTTLIGVYSHLNFQINGEYNKAKQKTTLKYQRIKAIPDDISLTLKRLFGKTYGEKFDKKTTYNFKTNKFNGESGMVVTSGAINMSANKIRWHDANEEYGLYEEYNGKTKLNNTAYIDRQLNKYITPTIPFGNSNYGIMTIDSQFYTVQLVEVSYE